jgi:hypothetical protein
MKFRTTLVGEGESAAGIVVPPEVVESFGKGKKPPVKVTIKGYTYRSTVAVMGGVFMVGVSKANRTAAGVASGDEVEIDMELDTEPRILSVPEDFAAALDRDPQARAFFDGLSYSNRSRFTLSIEDAKTSETRQRRIDKSVATLHEGKI